MQRKAVSGLMLTLMLVGVLAMTLNIQPVKADWTWTETIYIRADGSIEPDTTPISSVDNTTYTFTDNILGDVPDYSSAIVVERDNIVIDGAGYILQVTGGRWGVDLSGRQNITVKNIEIRAFVVGIYAGGSSHSLVSNNLVIECENGITLVSSIDMRVTENVIHNNSWVSLSLQSSSNSVISRNHIINPIYGISIWHSVNSTVESNLVLNSTYWGLAVDGESIGITIRGNEVNGSNNNILILNSKEVLVKENLVTNSIEVGILVSWDSEIVIERNALPNCYVGISVWGTNNSLIIGNVVTDAWSAIVVYFSNFNVTIQENSILSSKYAGIGLNGYGGIVENTRIFHNNFVDNANSVVFFRQVGTNSWDNGYPSGGNYWSDYADVDLFSGPYQNETGSDGIWDHPYVIDANNQDNYPLMNPWTVSPEKAIEDLIRDVESMNLQQGIDNSLDAKLDSVLKSLEALNADQRNDAINKLYAFINEVEAQRGNKITDEQADYLVSETQRIIDLIEG